LAPLFANGRAAVARTSAARRVQSPTGFEEGRGAGGEGPAAPERPGFGTEVDQVILPVQTEECVIRLINRRLLSEQPMKFGFALRFLHRFDS
jgi:hypothetical protein